MMVSLAATAMIIIGVVACVIVIYQRVAPHAPQHPSNDQNSQELTENLIPDFNELLKTSTQINKGINELRLESQTTASAIAMISRLADQTKLLALNANKATSDERLTLINDEFRDIAGQFIVTSSQLQEILSRLNGGATDLLALSEHNQQLSQLTLQHITQKIPLSVSPVSDPARNDTTSTTQVRVLDE